MIEPYSLLFNPEVENLISHDEIFNKSIKEYNYNSYRTLTFERLKKIINSQVIDTFKIVDEPTEFFSIMNSLHAYDMSLAIKTGVNFGLFGAGLLRLGHYNQVKCYVEQLNKGEIFGCLAITEIGHGSDLKRLETTATWIPGLDSFKLNSPTDTSLKCWIGNAFCHATHGIVFAQLIFEGKNLGLHPFLVQLRKDNEIVSGIEIIDNGYKKGLNGVDNGIIKFCNITIPRESLLSNYGYIDVNHKYITRFESENERFGELLSTLSGGRAALASGSTVVSLKALTIACKYALIRKQFSGKDGAENIIMHYLTHKLNLLPLLAKSFILNGTFKVIKDKSIQEFKENGKVTKKLHALTSGFKIMCGEHAETCCRVARIACGGHGYSWDNQFGKMHADIDIYQTFEGDNNLLRQEVCKYKLLRLKDYVDKNEFSQKLYGLKMSLNKKIISMVGTICYNNNYHDPDTILRLLKYKEKYITLQLVMKLANDIQNKRMEVFNAWNSSLDIVVDVANTHINTKLLQLFIGNYSMNDQNYRNIALLFGIDLLFNNSQWFVAENIFTDRDMIKIIELRKEYCFEIYNNLNSLLDKINIHPLFLDVPMLKIYNAKL